MAFFEAVLAYLYSLFHWFCTIFNMMALHPTVEAGQWLLGLRTILFRMTFGFTIEAC